MEREGRELREGEREGREGEEGGREGREGGRERDYIYTRHYTLSNAKGIKVLLGVQCTPLYGGKMWVL